MACAYGRHSIIKLLISKGADKTIKDDSGRTAKEIAEEFELKVKFDLDDDFEKLERKISNLKIQNDSLESKLKELEKKIEKIEKTKLENEKIVQRKKTIIDPAHLDDEKRTQIILENKNVKVAVYDYEGSEGALSMTAGDAFEILEVNGEWCSVVDIKTGLEGWVPTDYLQ